MKRVYDDQQTGAEVLLDPFPNWTRLSWVSTPVGQRGKGGATRALARALADADREGVRLFLFVEADANRPGLDDADLALWYMRHGFVAGDTTQGKVRYVREPEPVR